MPDICFLPDMASLDANISFTSQTYIFSLINRANVFVPPSINRPPGAVESYF
jgi:hypothetical protein